MLVLKPAPGPTQFRGYHPLRLVKQGDCIQVDDNLVQQIWRGEFQEAEEVSFPWEDSPQGRGGLKFEQRFGDKTYTIWAERVSLSRHSFRVVRVDS